MNMIYFPLDGLNIRAVMSVISQVLAFDVLNTAKSMCFGKNVIEYTNGILFLASDSRHPFVITLKSWVGTSTNTSLTMTFCLMF